MTEHQYHAPVSQLLEYGKPNVNKFSNYLALGFNETHIPELIRLVQDEFEYNKDAPGDVRWAARIHAWRTLAQLKASTAVPVLIAKLHEIDEFGDDWIDEEFPEVFAMIGPVAIPDLQCYLHNKEHTLYARIAAARALEEIGKIYPEERSNCIEKIENTLRYYRINDAELNAFLISSLVDLEAIESLPLIRSAFEADCVNWGVNGDLEEVEIRIGVREKRSAPRPSFSPFNLPTPDELFNKLESGYTPYVASHKIGRNEPCPCGSGKKYKKCCLNKEK